MDESDPTVGVVVEVGDMAHSAAASATRTQQARKPAVQGPGLEVEAVRRPAEPRRSTSYRRGSRGASPREDRSGRPGAVPHNNPCHTSPGTTPTRSRACHTIPSVGPLPAHRVRHPAGIAAEPPVVGQLVLLGLLGNPAAARTETVPTRAPGAARILPLRLRWQTIPSPRRLLLRHLR